MEILKEIMEEILWLAMYAIAIGVGIILPIYLIKKALASKNDIKDIKEYIRKKEIKDAEQEITNIENELKERGL